MKFRGTWQLKGRAGVILGVVAVASAVSGVAFWGAKGAPQQRSATTPKTAPAPAAASDPVPVAPAASSAYHEGVVAYLYNGTPITREQLGEYLIDRFGGERLEPFINRVIVERACQERKITVDPGEVDADLAETLKSVPGDKRSFLDNLLRQKQLTLKEWKDDVIRPKLLLSKYCRDRVRFTEEDVTHAFDSMYGEKVMVQIIIWTPEEVQKKHHIDLYEKIAKDKEAFDDEARHQLDRKLAVTAGQLTPFGRYSQENHEMEELAFKLKEGEITPPLSLFQGRADCRHDPWQRPPHPRTVRRIPDRPLRRGTSRLVLESSHYRACLQGQGHHGFEGGDQRATRTVHSSVRGRQQEDVGQSDAEAEQGYTL
jgi:hypothetical protein